MPRLIPLTTWREYPPGEMLARARAFADEMQRRRSVRHFTDRPVERAIIDECLRAAASAPSGANLQPWHFVVVSDPAVKHAIRVEAEAAEHDFYQTAPAEWLQALEPLGTDDHKPYLDTAPYLIVVFAQRYGMGPDGHRIAHYYVMESVGIACGLLLAGLHHAGLATLTHTPSPMAFLGQLLNRPANERAVMVIVAGYPAADARVPDIARKPPAEVVGHR